MNQVRQISRTLPHKKRWSHTRICFAVTIVALIGWIATYDQQTQGRVLLNETSANEDGRPPEPTFMDEDGVCANALPYGKLHDERTDEIDEYEKKLTAFALGFNRDEVAQSYDREPPVHQVLPPGSSVANWDCAGFGKKCINPHVNARNIVKGSAWTSDGVDAFEEKKGWSAKMSMKEDHERIWVPHEKYEFLATKRTVITGDAAAFFGFFPSNFGHCLHDNFPMVAWIKSIVPDHTTLILPDTDMYRKLLTFIDPSFVENRVYFFQSNEIVTVEGGTLTVAKPNSIFPAQYGNTMFRPLRHWIFENHPEHYPEEEDNFIVFYTRAGPHTEHGRVLEPQHEQDVLAVIRAMMEKYNRKEKIVIFSGQDEQGNILPLEEQFDIFRRASTIIGPHGSGLANNIWTYPFPTDCNKRVQMLEFISGSETGQIQSAYNGYYWVMRGMPIDWHQVLYASNSTASMTYIHLDMLREALDDMWGPGVSVMEA